MFKLFASIFVMITLGGTGVSFIAEAAKPGDFLYPIKTEVNERVRGWFTISYVADLGLQVNILEERLSEIEALVEEGKLTPDVAAEAQSKIVAKIESINQTAASTKLSDLSPQDKQRLAEALGRLQVALIKYKDSLVVLDVEAKKSTKNRGGGKSTKAAVAEVIVEISDEVQVEVEEGVELIVEEELAVDLEIGEEEVEETSEVETEESEESENIEGETDQPDQEGEDETGVPVEVEGEAEVEVVN